MHVHLYHLALDLVMTAPLELTEHHFAVAREFGGTQEEQRFRDAQRKAQLALLPPAPMPTKAAPPSSAMRPEVLADHLAQTINGLFAPMTLRVAAAEAATRKTDGGIAAAMTVIAEAHKRMDGLQAHLGEVEQENATLRKALGMPDPHPDPEARVH